MSAVSLGEERRLATLDRFRGEVQSGLAADFIYRSNSSADRMNYRHMLPASSYGDVLRVLGSAAALGDVYADAAWHAASRISPFLNDWQVMAAVASAFAEFIRRDWADTREATGPEAGRPSSHVRKVALREAVVLHLVMAEMTYALQLGTLPGVGWALRDLATEVDALAVVRFALPRVAASLSA